MLPSPPLKTPKQPLPLPEPNQRNNGIVRPIFLPSFMTLKGDERGRGEGKNDEDDGSERGWVCGLMYDIEMR